MTDIEKKKICNKQGKKEEFDERKLYGSVYRPAREAGYSKDDAQELANGVCEDIVKWLEDHEDRFMTSEEIREKVVEVLEERDDDVAFLYDKFLDIN